MPEAVFDDSSGGSESVSDRLAFQENQRKVFETTIDGLLKQREVIFEQKLNLQFLRQLEDLQTTIELQVGSPLKQLYEIVTEQEKISEQLSAEQQAVPAPLSSPAVGPEQNGGGQSPMAAAPTRDGRQDFKPRSDQDSGDLQIHKALSEAADLGLSKDDIMNSRSRSVLRKLLYRYFAGWMNRWQKLKEPEREGPMANLVNGGAFQTACAFVILMNGIFTVYTTNYQVEHLNPTSTPVQRSFELLFMCLYTVELLLKLMVHHVYFFVNEDATWNIFDMVLVLLGLYDMAMFVLFGDAAGFNASFMRFLRIVKLGKVLRVFRLMRMFRELRLILNSLISSLASLFWNLVMMVMIFFMFGLVLVQGLTGYLIDEGQAHSDDELLLYFGSVQDAICTLFMVVTSGLGWADFFPALLRTGNLYAGMFIFFVAFYHVALINIQAAVFVETAIDIAKPDRDALVFDKRRAMLERNEELDELFKMVDKDGEGTLSMQEFTDEMLNPNGLLRTWLEAEGLDLRDADLFFRMLSAGEDSGKVSISAFIEGCNRLQGGPTSLDIQAIMWQTKHLHDKQKEQTLILQSLENRLAANDRRCASVHRPFFRAKEFTC